MSLATRITLLVAAVLAASGLAAGAALHRAAARALDAQLQGRLDARLAWLRWSLDVELDDGELQLDARDDPPAAAEYWQVATAEGRVLWSSPGAAPSGPMSITKSQAATFGPAEAPAVPGVALVPADDADSGAGPGAARRTGWAPVAPSDVTGAALEAARAAVPGLELRGAERKTRVKKKDADAPALFELWGDAAGRRYDVRVAADGTVARVRDRAADQFTEYEIAGVGGDEGRGGSPGSGTASGLGSGTGPGAAAASASTSARRLDLVLTATASTAAGRAELAALSRLLWTAGPLALGLTAALLALLVRWQLAPLARVAREASDIGPASAARRIGPAGTSAELVRLRAAMNAMLARLAEGLERERRFASTAAHELRTPLAQMRTAVEVALRRPRAAEEYREALEGVSADVERLQKLVVGLLHLTWSKDDTGALGHPVPLADLLRRATAACAPSASEGVAGADGFWVMGDPDLLQSALCNVLENAARHAPPGPPAVRVEGDGAGRVRVIVADRGPGIPEADRERVFEPLTRLEPARADGGFGLGLAVARTTARAFGGDLVCRGRADGASGAEFVFTFLSAPSPAEDAPESAPEDKSLLIPD